MKKSNFISYIIYNIIFYLHAECINRFTVFSNLPPISNYCAGSDSSVRELKTAQIKNSQSLMELNCLFSPIPGHFVHICPHIGNDFHYADFFLDRAADSVHNVQTARLQGGSRCSGPLREGFSAGWQGFEGAAAGRSRARFRRFQKGMAGSADGRRNRAAATDTAGTRGQRPAGGKVRCGRPACGGKPVLSILFLIMTNPERY